MQGRAPEPCRRRHCPAQAGWPHRRARRKAPRHAGDGDGATRRGLTSASNDGRPPEGVPDCRVILWAADLSPSEFEQLLSTLHLEHSCMRVTAFYWAFVVTHNKRDAGDLVCSS